MKNIILLVFFLIISNDFLFCQIQNSDSLTFLQKQVSKVKTEIVYENYSSGVLIITPSIFIHNYEGTSESSNELDLLRTGISYPNTPFEKYKINFDLVKATSFPFFFPMQLKLININSNSSNFELYNIEWIKVGMGLGGNLLSNEGFGPTTPYPAVERFAYEKAGRNYLMVYFRFNFGYTSFNIDDRLVSLDKSYKSLLEDLNTFDFGITLGFYFLVHKNILISVDYNRKSYFNEDYLFSFGKLNAGAEIFLVKFDDKSYLAGYIKAIQDFFELTNDAKKVVIFKENQEGFSVGLCYHL
jgi:hypothetical protein